jgi:hypothetical protein
MHALYNGPLPMHDVRSARAAIAHRARRFTAASPLQLLQGPAGGGRVCQRHRQAGARRCIVCSNGPRAEAYWHRDNGLPRPEPTDEDRRAERAAIVRDAMGLPPLPPPPPQGRHRRRHYRAKHRYRSEMQRIKRRLKLKATK